MRTSRAMGEGTGYREAGTPRAIGSRPRGLLRTPSTRSSRGPAPGRSASQVRGLGSAARRARTPGGRRPPPWGRRGASPSSLRRSRRRPLSKLPVARRGPEIPRRRRPCREVPRPHVSARRAAPARWVLPARAVLPSTGIIRSLSSVYVIAPISYVWSLTREMGLPNGPKAGGDRTGATRQRSELERPARSAPG